MAWACWWDLSEKPVILAGWGAYPYASLVLAFARAVDAPIISTFRAKGIVPDGHPQYAGILGTVGSSYVRDLVEQSDLLVTLGVGFSKMTRVPEGVPLLQVDRDPLKLGKGNRSLPVFGDVSEVLTRLLPGLRQRGRPTAVRRVKAVVEPWQAQLRREADAQAVPLRPPFIMDTLSEVIPEDAVISVDVGENGWWFGRNFRMKRQRFIMSGYLATMGFALPGAIAAKIASPDRQIFCITGDGGFAMAMADFVTAVRDNLPMVVVILNNHELGMIRVEQMVEHYEPFATRLHNPDFVQFARSCGGDGKKVTVPADLSRALMWAMQQEKPVIVDIETDPDRFSLPLPSRHP